MTPSRANRERPVLVPSRTVFWGAFIPSLRSTYDNESAALLWAYLFCAGAATAPRQEESAKKETRGGPMALVHGGTITMGIEESEIPKYQKLFGIDHEEVLRDLAPKQQVTVKDFYIDRYLVTNADFREFVEAMPVWQPNHLLPEFQRFDNGNYLRHWAKPSQENAKPDHPVVNVNILAAGSYCRWVGKRLPTEAEWEFAARGGSNSLFPWGDELPDRQRANFGNHVGTTTAVGSYPANAFGLYDMAGNVWQFMADRWGKYPSAFSEDSVYVVSGLPETRRVIRGGSYAGAPVNLWVEYRDSHPGSGSQDFVGFRCAKSAVTESHEPDR